MSYLCINHQNQSVRVRAHFGYRDFTLDELSLSEEDDIEAFYSKFVESRVDSVKLGEAKMQTAKINQGNIALKRVVESNANGDSHIPFKDDKLTMLFHIPLWHQKASSKANGITLWDYHVICI